MKRQPSAISTNLPPGARTPDIPSPMHTWDPYLNPSAQTSNASGSSASRSGHGYDWDYDEPYTPYAETGTRTGASHLHPNSQSLSAHLPSHNRPQSLSKTPQPQPRLPPRPPVSTRPTRSASTSSPTTGSGSGSFNTSSISHSSSYSPTQSTFTEASYAFPEPHPGRSPAYAQSLINLRQHRPSKSEAPSLPPRRESLEFSIDFAQSSPPLAPSIISTTSSLSEELSNLSLDSSESLRKFQAGLLPSKDEEWHVLVPDAAREALGKHEVERQSVLFEIFKAERDYVGDLVLVQEVFIDALRTYEPPLMDRDRLAGFIREVFWNIDALTAHHRRMLDQLFARQREQHPVILSVADIVLDTCLSFRDDYESYIKHYPLAEARHRAELKRNRDYQYFMLQLSQDPRVRKHDLATFLSRPVTRLPRLALVLEHLHKLAEPGSDDHESLPLTLNILSDFIKSTQPGIEAADLKAKFWELAESLVFVRGEMIDMDLYDEKRTLVHSGPLSRRDSEWSSWSDHFVALLDNYLVLTREESRGVDVLKRHVVSRPIPLEYLKVAQSHGAPQTRRERSEHGSSAKGLLSLSGIRGEARPAYPLTFWHAGDKNNRRYTMYATSEGVRRKWENAIVDAISVRRAHQEANMWFAPHVVSDGFFSQPGPSVPEAARLQYTGKITCATSFSIEGQSFVVVGTLFGVWIAHKAMPKYQKVLNIMNASSITAVPDFDKLIVHARGNVSACSLSALARFTRTGTKSADGRPLTQVEVESAVGLRRVTDVDDNVLFARVGRVGNRTLLFYAVKSLMQVNVLTLEMVDVQSQLKARSNAQTPPAFRQFGEPVTVPKDVHDLTTLVRSIAICGEKGTLVVDPTHPRAITTVVPDFRQSSVNPAMAGLKTRCDGSRPLGILKCESSSELMVIYDDLACFVDKYGAPSRQSGFVRWESKAESFTQRGRLVLLFSPTFIEIRDVNSGRLVEVLEGQGIRRLQADVPANSGDGVFVAMQSTVASGSNGTQSEKIVELLQTAEIGTGGVDSKMPASELWREWDMAV